MWILKLIRYTLQIIFFHFVVCIFTFLIMSFVQKFFILMTSNLYIFLVLLMVFVSHIRNHGHIQCHNDLCLFPSKDVHFGVSQLNPKCDFNIMTTSEPHIGKNYIGHVECLEEHNIEWNIILCSHPFGYYLILVLKSRSSVKEKVEMLLFSFMPICSTQNSVIRGGENVFMEN